MIYLLRKRLLSPLNFTAVMYFVFMMWVYQAFHRLINSMDELATAKVVIAVAGMEGALASVVGGMVDCPVIAVPTSVGYGANFGLVFPLFCPCLIPVQAVSVLSILITALAQVTLQI